jgi:hypothetical protein
VTAKPILQHLLTHNTSSSEQHLYEAQIGTGKNRASSVATGLIPKSRSNAFGSLFEVFNLEEGSFMKSSCACPSLTVTENLPNPDRAKWYNVNKAVY